MARAPRILKSKVCGVCKIRKPGRLFHKCKGNSDGLQYRCRGCIKVLNDAAALKANMGHGLLDREINKHKILHLEETYKNAVGFDARMRIRREIMAVTINNYGD